MKKMNNNQRDSSEPWGESHPIPHPVLLPEMVVEILLRLPVESVLQVRSVCKLWRSFISHPQFVKFHLKLSIRNDHFARYRLIFSSLPKLILKICPLYEVLHYKSGDAVELEYPLKHPYKSVWVAGSCDGLLCIAVEEDVLILWNPVTKRSNKLPYCCGVKGNPGWYVLYGLGYHESTDDYKVVRICYDTGVEVFAIKTGNWRRIGDFPCGIPLDDSGKFLNGALHWAASRDTWTIVSLDLAKESYGEVAQPRYDEGDYDLNLGVLDEWLCVLCNYRGSHADVWGMKVYGVRESWTKVVSIPYLTDPGRDQYSVPLCVSNDGKFLLQFGSKFVIYDAIDYSFSDIRNLDACLEAHTYVESLVSPDLPSRPWG